MATREQRIGSARRRLTSRHGDRDDQALVTAALVSVGSSVRNRKPMTEDEASAEVTRETVNLRKERRERSDAVSLRR